MGRQGCKARLAEWLNAEDPSLIANMLVCIINLRAGCAYKNISLV